MADKGGLSAKEYERIGREIEVVVYSGYGRKRRLIAANLLRGIFFGLGTTIGISIMLALLLYLLTLFSDLPLIGDLFDRAKETIERSR